MNRLTEKRDDGSYKLKGTEWDPPLRPRSGKLLMNKIYGVIQRLGAYEDTGLMPDEIGKLNAETQEQARAMLERVAKLSDEIERMKGEGRQQWIPVTKQLPEPESYALVSFENASMVDIASYRIDENGDGAFYPRDEDTSYVSVGIFVNAWMPLPEPYEEGK